LKIKKEIFQSNFLQQGEREKKKGKCMKKRNFWLFCFFIGTCVKAKRYPTHMMNHLDKNLNHEEPDPTQNHGELG